MTKTILVKTQMVRLVIQILKYLSLDYYNSCYIPNIVSIHIHVSANQAWGEYIWKVFEYECEYLPIVRMRIRIRIHIIESEFEYKYIAKYSWIHSWILPHGLYYILKTTILQGITMGIGYKYVCKEARVNLGMGWGSSTNCETPGCCINWNILQYNIEDALLSYRLGVLS